MTSVPAHTAADRPWDLTEQSEVTWDTLIFHPSSMIPSGMRSLAACIATNCYRDSRILIVFSYALLSSFAGIFGFRSFYVYVYVWFFVYLFFVLSAKMLGLMQGPRFRLIALGEWAELSTMGMKDICRRCGEVLTTGTPATDQSLAGELKSSGQDELAEGDVESQTSLSPQEIYDWAHAGGLTNLLVMTIIGAAQAETPKLLKRVWPSFQPFQAVNFKLAEAPENMGI